MKFNKQSIKINQIEKTYKGIPILSYTVVYLIMIKLLKEKRRHHQCHPHPPFHSCSEHEQKKSIC